ncbi:MAG: radical SAM protein, partial [Phycisphaerales bacterium]|nr:radical SAM protein [Phycisphaerales bacterium]
MSLPLLTPSRTIKTTTSRCPRCLAVIEAVVHERDGMVIMSKRCDAHGAFDVVLARDPRFYHRAVGARDEAGACCGGSACCAPSVDNGSVDVDPFEVLSTCIALIEIVDSCNLACPTCYAGSPVGVGDDVDAISLDAYRRRVGGVIERKGFIDIIQLSGGEPTIHPEFFELLDWTLDQKDIGYILINTNGVRVAHDAAFR